MKGWRAYKPNKYFLLATDDATRVDWIRYIKDKTAVTVVPILIEIIKDIEKEIGEKVTIIRTDNGRSEFGIAFQNKLKKLGIQFEPSPSGKYSINGVAEKHIQDISARSKSLLNQAGMLEDQWELTTRYIIWLCNKAFTKALSFGESGSLSTVITLFGVYYSRLPDFINLQVFSYKVFALNLQFPGKLIKKFESRILKRDNVELLNTTCKHRLRKIFSNQVVQKVKALKVVIIDTENSTLTDDPEVPLEAIELEEAMREDRKQWLKAIKSELTSLQENGTFQIIQGNVPKGKTLITSKLVIKGYLQHAGIDFKETFAGVGRYFTLRTLLAKTTVEDLEIDNMDVDIVFLNEKLTDTKILMEIPQFFEEVFPEIKEMLLKSLQGTKVFLKLKKSLYSLKQTPRIWWLAVKKFLKNIGLTASSADPNLFIGNGVYILLYMDNLLIIGNRTNIDKIKTKISAKWKCKDLGPTRMFLGLQIEYNRPKRTIKIHNSNYTKRIL
ncbi:Gag-Pol polyprotein [Sclerotinia borealis F-4128]|uniref:Gag-Pol polyprotein n=1 Tax=Sclerotinia borealis (strain F-4128) TaxID=1432307 RepID=W9C201_SCLBF|nr:Gag-Pol polyprotein [Sclerotinia borealis F-4128]